MQKDVHSRQREPNRTLNEHSLIATSNTDDVHATPSLMYPFLGGVSTALKSIIYRVVTIVKAYVYIQTSTCSFLPSWDNFVLSLPESNFCV